MDTIPTRVSLGLIHQSITGKLGPLEGHFKAAHLSVEMQMVLDCSLTSLEPGLYKSQRNKVVSQGDLCEKEKSRDVCISAEAYALERQGLSVNTVSYH